MEKLKGAVRAAGMVLVVVGFLLAIGTAGSCDCNLIGTTEVLIREGIAGAMIAGGAFAADAGVR